MALRPESGPSTERVERVASLLASPAPEPIQPSSHSGALLMSALLFFAMDARGGDLLGAGLLLAAVFVHELGHYAAMRAFGFRNARIMFLPMMGGVTVGEAGDAGDFQRAVVAISGPAPSIFLGAGLVAAAFPLHSVLSLRAGLTVLSLNLLNLLPIAGLDGGNFFQRVMGPSPRAALVFRLVTGAAGLGFAGLHRMPLLGLWFGFMLLRSWTQEFPIDRLAARLRSDLGGSPIPAALPPERVGWLVAELDRSRPDPKTTAPEQTAVQALEVWNRARRAPVPWRRRAALGALYLSCWAVGLAGTFGWRLLLR